MADEDRGYRMGARNIGWLIAALYFIQSCLTIALPRTDKTLPMRGELRHWHMLVGVILLVLLVDVSVRHWRSVRSTTLPPTWRLSISRPAKPPPTMTTSAST